MARPGLSIFIKTSSERTCIWAQERTMFVTGNALPIRLRRGFQSMENSVYRADNTPMRPSCLVHIQRANGVSLWIFESPMINRRFLALEISAPKMLTDSQKPHNHVCQPPTLGLSCIALFSRLL